jgi:hypothetical protein
MSPLRLSPALAGLLAAAALHAQSAHWESAGGTLPVGQVTSVQLVLENCEANGTPAPPAVDGLTLEFDSQSSNVSWINGDYSRSVTYNYAALLSRKAAVEIPAFDVDTNKGRVRVPAVRFRPTDATVGSSGQTLENTASSSLALSSNSVWAGEVFNLAYRIDAATSYTPDFGHGEFTWDSSPLLTEDWTEPEPVSVANGEEARTGLAYRSRAIVRNPGTYSLHPITQLVNLSVGVTGFGFFQQRQYQQFAVTSNTPVIEVRPLPPAPAGFNGAVGEFKLVSRVVPSGGAVGEPITWTLELSGTGNWPDFPGLPPREVSRDFQVVQPKAKRTPAAGKLFTSTLSEDVVLVPTSPGTYELEPFRFVYFEPRSGTYQTLSTPRTEVVVTPAVLATGAASGPAAAPEGTAAAPSAPELPSGLPRDPLPGPGSAPVPWDGATLGLSLLLPAAALVLSWIGFALGRARRDDPARPRREARLRLAATLRDLRTAAPGDPGSLGARLLAWQQDAAAFWGVPHAAPSSSQVAAAASEPAAWAALWEEADRALYGPAGTLPEDWIGRAESALASARAPGFSPARIFLPRNLFPFLVSAALLALAVPPARADASASAAYRRGDFGSAEAGWRADAKTDPSDWTARYDLSLALGQQNRWDEAAAQAAAAFVQEPGDASVRWQLALACDKAGFVPTALAGFVPPDSASEFAELASPATWQRLLLAGAALAALCLGLLLARGYGFSGGRWLVPSALVALLAAVLLSLASVAGIRAYGVAADSRAVVVWRNGTLRSVPTEADTSQKTSPLPAGTVGVADRSFLGWVRLSFDNGQTGWVRREETIGLWR